MAIGGAVLRFGSLFIRTLQFLCAAIGLGIFSYFLSVLADNNLNIRNRWLAVEGITGAATLYTLIAVLLTLFLGGKALFSYLAIFFDILFVGAFVAVVWFTRHGANSCSGNVQTPLGNGPSNRGAAGYGSNGFGFGDGENATYSPNLGLACRLNTAVFAVSLIAIFLFLVSAVWEFLMMRHHKKEKKYGPGPNNNYTSGSGRKPFWKRGNRKTRHTKDAEVATTGGLAGTRASHETGTTLGNNAYAAEPKLGEPGYGDATYGQIRHGHGHTHTAQPAYGQTAQPGYVEPSHGHLGTDHNTPYHNRITGTTAPTRDF